MKYLLLILFASINICLTQYICAQNYIWTGINSGISSNLFNVSFPNAMTGYIIGYNKLMRSTDAGFTWTILPDAVPWSGLGQIYGNYIKFVSPAIGFISLADGSFMRTTNNCKTWTPYITPTAKTDFTSKDTAYSIWSDGPAQGNYVKEYRTFNGGISWDTVRNIGGFYTVIYGVKFVNNSVGFIYGEYYHTYWDVLEQIYMTTDKGVNFYNVLNDPVSYGGIKNVIFPGNQVGYSECAYKYYRTNSGGSSWISTAYNSTHYNVLCFMNDSVGFGKYYSEIYKTSDGCISWIADRTLSINSMALISPNTAIAVGDGGIINRVTLSGSNSPIQTNLKENEIVLDFKLNQNYPDPFNPVTKISFNIPADNLHVKLSIFDVNGSEIEVITEGYLKSGYHEYTWHPSNIASGIYFYKLTAGIFTAVNKMAFIK